MKNFTIPSYKIHRTVSLLLALFFVVLLSVGQTHSWQSIGQNAKNSAIGVTTEEETGNLMIEKIVRNNDGSELTSAQTSMLFRFTVTFSDENNQSLLNAFPYQIFNADGTPHGTLGEVQSGRTIYLRHGQSVEIIDIPLGTRYTVAERHELGFNVPQDRNNTITAGENFELFENIYTTTPVESTPPESLPPESTPSESLPPDTSRPPESLPPESMPQIPQPPESAPQPIPPAQETPPQPPQRPIPDTRDNANTSFWVIFTIIGLLGLASVATVAFVAKKKTYIPKYLSK